MSSRRLVSITVAATIIEIVFTADEMLCEDLNHALCVISSL